MFNPEDLDVITQAPILAIFFLKIDYSEDSVDDGNASRYAIIVINTRQFNPVAKYLSSGISLHQVAHGMFNTKELLRIGSIGSCSGAIVICYALFICAMNLQCIVDIFWKCWAFSVALNMATHMATVY